MYLNSISIEELNLLIGKVWVPVMHFCACPIRCKAHWSVGRRQALCRFDFRSAFDRVFHKRILYKLCCMGIACSVLSISALFPSNRSLHVMVDACHSKLVDVVSGVPLGSILGPLLFLLYVSLLFSILENKLICYADDSTLVWLLCPPQAF